MRALIIPSNLNGTPSSSSAKRCMSPISCWLIVTATVFNDSGRPRSFSSRMPRMQRSNEPGDARQPFVSLPRAPVQRDFDRERRPLGQRVGDRLGDLRAVREQRDQEPAHLGVQVDLQEVTAREDLAAGEQQPQPARVGQLVDDPFQLVGGQLAPPRLGVADGQVVVAVGAGEGAPVGDLQRRVDGQPRAARAAVQRAAPLGVGQRSAPSCFVLPGLFALHRGPASPFDASRSRILGHVGQGFRGADRELVAQPLGQVLRRWRRRRSAARSRFRRRSS